MTSKFSRTLSFNLGVAGWLAAALLASPTLSAVNAQQRKAGVTYSSIEVSGQQFVLSSRDVREGSALGRVHTGCDPRFNNISPELAWRGAPAGTRSFAITLGRGRPGRAEAGYPTFLWSVFNLPATTNALVRGAGADSLGLLPARAFHGAYGSVRSYNGPCVEGESERFTFTIYALDTDSVARDIQPLDVSAYLQNRALGKATLSVLVSR